MARRSFDPSGPFLRFCLLMGTGILLVGSAFALPQYRLQAIKQFHYKGSPLKKSTMGCTFCHVKDAGGAPWNAFGENLRQTLRENPSKSMADALYLVLAKDLDSDDDGYGDALEVYAHTLPGDPSSKPTQKLEDLQAEFVKSGGLEQYQAAEKK